MVNYIKSKIKNWLISRLSIRKKVRIPVYNGILLKGKKAIITGGTSGIGYASALAFICNGAKVVITGRDMARLQEAQGQLAKDSNCSISRIETICLDLLSYDTWKSRLELYLNNSEEQIDILVNSAGINIGDFFPDTKEEDFDRVVNTNLKGTYLVSQIVASYMIKNNIRGNILNLASSSSLRPATSSYTISKWGIKGITLGMAKKLIKYGIVVNGIAPGPTATNMLGMENADNLFLASSPSKRYLTPEEAANWAVFLVSDLGRMVVGDILYITGGAGVITYDDIGY